MMHEFKIRYRQLEELLKEKKICEDDCTELQRNYWSKPNFECEFRMVREILFDAIKNNRFNEIDERLHLEQSVKDQITEIMCKSTTEQGLGLFRGRQNEIDGTSTELDEAEDNGQSDVKNSGAQIPDYLKEQAELFAECRCKYELKLAEGTEEYKKAYIKAYARFLKESQFDGEDIKKPVELRHPIPEERTINSNTNTINFGNANNNHTSNLSIVGVIVIGVVALVVIGGKVLGQSQSTKEGVTQASRDENDSPTTAVKSPEEVMFRCHLKTMTVTVSTDENQAFFKSETGDTAHKIVKVLKNECGRNSWVIRDSQKGYEYRLNQSCRTEHEFIWPGDNRELCGL